MLFFARFTRIPVAFDPEYLRNMRIIDRSAQRRHGLDASAFNSFMFFGWFFLECPCRIAVPIDRAERLEGFRCIRLHRHQVVSVVGFDDAAGGISDCVQRVYRDNMSGKRHFFEKRRDGSSLATLVMKTVTGNGQSRVMRNQSCGFEMAVPVAVRTPAALAIGGKRRAEFEPRRRPTLQYRFSLRRVRPLKNPVYD